VTVVPGFSLGWQEDDLMATEFPGAGGRKTKVDGGHGQILGGATNEVFELGKLDEEKSRRSSRRHGGIIAWHNPGARSEKRDERIKRCQFAG
jgi:hypothetical protein